MKKDELVAKNNNSTQETESLKIPLYETISLNSEHEVNHKRLSAVLQEDMLQASSWLMGLRANYVAGNPVHSLTAVEILDKALALLDCIEHIPEMSEEEDFEETMHAAIDTATERAFGASHEDDKPQKSIQHIGVITAIRKVTTRKGQQIAIMTLDTDVDIAVFPRTWQLLRDFIEILSRSKTEAAFDCQSDDKNGYILNSIAGFERIENTTEALKAESTRLTNAIKGHEAKMPSDDEFYNYTNSLNQLDYVNAELDRRAPTKKIRGFGTSPEYDTHRYCDDCGKIESACICWEQD